MGVTASRTLSVAASPTDLSDITFRTVEPSRYPEILELLYANFHTDEPMSRALQIYDGVHRVPAVDEYTLAALGENLSIMAVDAITNKLLGVAINGLSRAEDADVPLEEKVAHVRNDKFAHILGALHEVNQRADPAHLYSDLGADVLFDIKMVTTDKQNRRGGLGTDLLRRSVERARAGGYRACKTEATGRYSRKAFERLGFTVAAELPYHEYMGVDGERVFASVGDSHRSIALLTLKLNQPEGSSGTAGGAIAEEKEEEGGESGSSNHNHI